MMRENSLPSICKFKYRGNLKNLYIELCKYNYLFTDYDMQEIYDLYDIVVYTNANQDENEIGKFSIKMVKKNKGFGYILDSLKKLCFGIIIIGAVFTISYIAILLSIYYK